ncbi:hypothetical protein BO71DRAFT_28845 [Aspergillus ellipticus CBS 707.79]|uniref:Uncharacterized protein n=1 Tax=Aspergillus ellipticus CBS 707.79 TaxID=1448320 RepID=A0A319DLS0_9EURO|nr:hypothetical protein BO71DRAFT_28845 [Aspergillus ellipticus CBS 707.79]
MLLDTERCPKAQAPTARRPLPFRAQPRRPHKPGQIQARICLCFCFCFCFFFRAHVIISHQLPLPPPTGNRPQSTSNSPQVSLSRPVSRSPTGSPTREPEPTPEAWTS